MNVYDLAYDLARGIKNSSEYKKYQEALSKIKGNPEREKILSDFRKKQMEIQAMQMMGQEVPEAKRQELEKVMEILHLHPSIKEFLEAEYHLGKVMADIHKILGESIELWAPDMGT
ncbi:MAG: YlbF family regulator [Clostridia bacterium]|nr:YlbF family regulator [Clostridia bacterium]